MIVMSMCPTCGGPLTECLDGCRLRRARAKAFDTRAELEAVIKERDALRAEVEKLRAEDKAAAELPDANEWLHVMQVRIEQMGRFAGDNNAWAIRLRIELLEADVARKVEPLTDEERVDLWDAVNDYALVNPASSADGRDRINAILDRLQGRGGET